MTTTATDPAAELLATLTALDVKLAIRGIRLLIDAPEGAVTPDLAGSIRRNKVELIGAVRLTKPCDRCGSDQYVDVAIHDGQSLRRDCCKCGFTRGFPRWYGVERTAV